MLNEPAVVVNNRRVAENLFIMTLDAPEIASTVAPGQFVHLQLSAAPDHILRRPFSILDTHPEQHTVEILYQVVGFGSQAMTEYQWGTRVELIGPVGHGWYLPEGVKHPLIVGAGVGAAPLYMFTRQLRRSFDGPLSVLIGAKSAEYLVCKPYYDALLTNEGEQGLACVQMLCTTDDGTYGFKGYCGQGAEALIRRSRGEVDSDMPIVYSQGACSSSFAQVPIDFVACCGPEIVMKSMAQTCEAYDIACCVSLEKRMACGVGACLSCVVNTVDGKKRSCVDGPVFDARKVVW